MFPATAVMFANLYDALRAAGGDESKARSAADEMASSLATVEDVRTDVRPIGRS